MEFSLSEQFTNSVFLTMEKAHHDKHSVLQVLKPRPINYAKGDVEFTFGMMESLYPAPLLDSNYCID